MKKRYYIPGIFSIVLLPILGIWYMNQHNYFQKLSAHSFMYMDFEEAKRVNEEEGNDFFSTDELFKRIYKEVILNHDKHDAITFDYIDQFVNHVVQTKDTINGLQIHFGKNATYNEFIEVLNIFDKRNAEIYTLDHNTMYFIGKNLPSEDNTDIDCTFIAYKIEEKAVPVQINELFQQNKIIYSAYGILFLVGIFYTIRNCKKPSK